MLWFKTKNIDGKLFVFDPLRQQYVSLTPEEKVRQKILYHLVEELHYPAGRIAVEHLVVVNNLPQRADIVVFNEKSQALILVECKAPSIKITQKTLSQALRYQSILHAHYIILTNSNETYCYLIEENGSIKALNQIPFCKEI